MTPTYNISSEEIGVPGSGRLLERIEAATEAQGISCFIVGALARDLLLEHIYGFRAPRATRDVDIAVMVEDWDAYERVIAAFSAEKGMGTTSQRHRLRTEEGVHLDIIPFGEIGGPTRQVAWPPRHDVEVNTLGFEEVYGAAVSVVFDHRITIRVASLAGLGVLKLIAWDDRKRETNKDAQDLCFIMRAYYDAHAEEVYEQHLDLFEENFFDKDLASARIFGRAIGRVVAGNERLTTTLREILRRETQDPDNSLLADMMGSICIYEYVQRFRCIQHVLQGLEEELKRVQSGKE